MRKPGEGGSDPSLARRGFLAGAATLPLAAPAQAQAPAAQPAAPAAAAPPPVAGNQFLGIEEAAFVEAMVDHMWPADDLTPSGTELGIAVYIDRQLAGAFGQGDRLYMQGPWRRGRPQHGWQVPMTPAVFFRAGLAAADAACRARFGNRSFDRLQPAEKEAFLTDIAAGRVQHPRIDLGLWFNALVYPLFLEGAFSDPIYGGNRNKAAWRMIGYPGLPAVYSVPDIVAHRGRRHPAAANPRSIADLS
ncbi:MAG: gluconate 2-dehydrogenase subunit 3 family protein [Acetobacteraceae bacterium]|nr:gluconate 2-dehydrogenase subunit 3 family protein [Acetobacteraceae bacterium]